MAWVVYCAPDRAFPSWCFWPSVEKTAGGCWLWTGPQTDAHYGRINFGGKQTTAHRFAYQLLRGPIPRGFVLDHFRRNRGPLNAPCSTLCVNPSHMEPVTKSENSLRGATRRSEPRAPDEILPQATAGRGWVLA